VILLKHVQRVGTFSGKFLNLLLEFSSDREYLVVVDSADDLVLDENSEKRGEIPVRMSSLDVVNGVGAGKVEVIKETDASSTRP
jgi:hypothetical protein